jgi:hypothetical protein
MTKEAPVKSQNVYRQFQCRKEIILGFHCNKITPNERPPLCFFIFHSASFLRV